MQIPNVDYKVEKLYPGGGLPVRQLMWDDKSQWRVMTQMYGSVWPKVLPFCILNMALCGIVWTFKHYGLDLTSEIHGHKYMAIMMSFLVITRLKLTLDQYQANAKYLTDTYRVCSELIQHVCVLTMSDDSGRAKQWRQDVAYHTIVLLRVTMAVLEFKSNPEAPPWNVPELDSEERRDLMHNSFLQEHQSRESLLRVNESPKWLSHAPLNERTVLEEASRAPIVLAHNLRYHIMKQRDGTWLQKDTFQHPANEELKMLDLVGEYMKAYAGLKNQLSTPLPFPLVQMTKTFLLVWCFTLSFALCHDYYAYPFAPCITLFMLTYGFLGSEFVGIELSDPYNNDPSDFDDLGYAHLTFEDIYISIYKLDGEHWARSLRARVVGRMVQARAHHLYGLASKRYKAGEEKSPTRTETRTERNTASPIRGDIVADEAYVKYDNDDRPGYYRARGTLLDIAPRTETNLMLTSIEKRHNLAGAHKDGSPFRWPKKSLNKDSNANKAKTNKT